MRTRIQILLILGAVSVFAQVPVLNSVQNAASYWAPSLPGSGIARGSMFVLKGVNLGPAEPVVAGEFPLRPTLGGVSVRVTVGGESVDAILYYALSRQVAAILPSSAAIGTGTVTLTRQGVTSAPLPITVVQSAPGLYTRAQSGNGLAVATHADYRLVSPDNAAIPGETIVLWANGLGPVSGDETRPAGGGNMGDVPLVVHIGGQPARVTYRGRNACCSSLDQINVEVPQGVAGCDVAVLLQVGGFTSNSASISVSPGGGFCTPSRSAVSSQDLARLLAKGDTISRASISLFRTVNRDFTGRLTRTESGVGSFSRTNAPGHLQIVSTVDAQAAGSCTVLSYRDVNTFNPFGAFSTQTLDAGPSLTISGPNGQQTLDRQVTSGSPRYQATFPSTSLTGFLDAGTYLIAGTGGPQVGSLHADLPVPPFSWTNRNSVVDVDRAQGVTVTWTGGHDSGFVTVGGYSIVPLGGNSFSVAAFTCGARASDGNFTVPPVVLQALPPVGLRSGLGSLQVTFDGEVPFVADGVDWGVAHAILTESDSSAGYR